MTFFIYSQSLFQLRIPVQRIVRDDTDWQLHNNAKEEYYTSQQRYLYDKQACGPTYYLTSTLIPRIKLHPDSADVADELNTNEWANDKQSTFDSKGNVLYVPLANYRFRIQNCADNFP